MAASGRRTDIGGELENFLDVHENDISINLWEGLEGLAATIDDMADNMEREKNEAQERVAELEKQVEELESENDVLQQELEAAK